MCGHVRSCATVASGKFQLPTRFWVIIKDDELKFDILGEKTEICKCITVNVNDV